MTRNIGIGIVSLLFVVGLAVWMLGSDPEDGDQESVSQNNTDQKDQETGRDHSGTAADAAIQEPSADSVESAASEPSQDSPPQYSIAMQPRFDVVRVAPDGAAVLAGRAPPGTVVHIYNGSDSIGRVEADKRGEWVWIPQRPFPPGQLELTLRSYGPGSDDFIESSEVVLMVLPERKPGTDQAALIVKVDRDGDAPSQLIQLPSGQSAAVDLALDTVDYGEDGALRLSGRAVPGSRLRLQLDGVMLGQVTVGDDSRWTLSPDRTVTAGDYLLRIERLDEKNRVMSSLELPFHRASREQIAQVADDPGNWVVQPGNSLWRIARHLYGKGVHFTVIYEANRSKISHPDLIYPGQIFTTPSGDNRQP